MDNFHAERREGLGGSDIGVLLGFSIKTPYELWLEKTGQEEQFEGNLATRMGTRLEEAVAQEYASATGHKVQRYHQMLRHPEAPLIGHPDRLVVPEGQQSAVWFGRIRARKGLECKTVNPHAFAAWNDELPDAYRAQAQTYMTLTGCHQWDVAALVGGNLRFEIFPVEHDPDLEERILALVSDWWDRHVIGGEPPTPTTEREARLRYAKASKGKTIVVEDDVASAIEELKTIRAEIAELERRKQALRNTLIPELGDATEIVDSDGVLLATYRQNRDSRKVNWEAISKMLPASVIKENTESVLGARVLRLIGD